MVQMTADRRTGEEFRAACARLAMATTRLRELLAGDPANIPDMAWTDLERAADDVMELLLVRPAPRPPQPPRRSPENHMPRIVRARPTGSRDVGTQA